MEKVYTKQVIIEKDLFRSKEWIVLIQNLANRFAIITDSCVERLFAETIKEILIEAGLRVSLFSFPAGEVYKTRTTKEALENRMLEEGFSRDTAIIAIGGGVVTDLAGFVAATFARGVPLVMIPTTLMGMVDASIGGKVGVNTEYGKNLIGAFYKPEYLLIDTAFLKTLPLKEFLNGRAEIIKYALIDSPDLLDGGNSIESVIERSIQIKQRVVGEDFKEYGLRRILNFGHTMGHALEAALSYTVSHGEAIGFGMRFEAKLAERLGFLDQDEEALIQEILQMEGFAFPYKISFEKINRAMRLDKKGSGGKVRFVILEKLGKVAPFEGEYCTGIDPKIVEEVWQHLM